MVRKRYPLDDPREWLNRARSNLAHAQAVSPEVFLEDLCFDAQQAAEKAIKAIFICRGEAFPPLERSGSPSGGKMIPGDACLTWTRE
jgi:hypothetical protein